MPPVRHPREGRKVQAAHHQAGESAPRRSAGARGPGRGALRQRVGARVPSGLPQTRSVQDAIPRRPDPRVHRHRDPQSTEGRHRRAADSRMRQVFHVDTTTEPAVRGGAETRCEEGVRRSPMRNSPGRHGTRRKAQAQSRLRHRVLLQPTRDGAVRRGVVRRRC